jgi:UDPglucose 6-dehydrogenase
VNPNSEVLVASNPEFLREGEAIGDFMNPDRIVVGVEDGHSGEVLQRLYAPLTENGAPLLLMRRRAAELVKYASNSFLATKITFINEMANLCEAVGADVLDVSRGMGLDRRIGASFLQPGPGYGGSCFPKDCNALVTTAQQYDVQLAVVQSAIQSNFDRKQSMANRILQAMGGNVEGRTIAMLGLTFKANTDDMRDAPAIPIIQALKKAGAAVKAYDPQGMGAASQMISGIEFAPSALACCVGADCIVIATEWQEFGALDPWQVAKVSRGHVICDLRNIIDDAEFVEAGFLVWGVGRPRGEGGRTTGRSIPWGHDGDCGLAERASRATGRAGGLVAVAARVGPQPHSGN